MSFFLYLVLSTVTATAAVTGQSPPHSPLVDSVAESYDVATDSTQVDTKGFLYWSHTSSTILFTAINLFAYASISLSISSIRSSLVLISF